MAVSGAFFDFFGSTKTGRNDNRRSPTAGFRFNKVSLTNNEIWACNLCHSGVGRLTT